MTPPLLAPSVRIASYAEQDGRLRALAIADRPVHSLARVLKDRAVVETHALHAVTSKGARTPGVDTVTGKKAAKNLLGFVMGVLATITSAVFMSLAVREVPKKNGAVRQLAVPTLRERAIGGQLAWMLNILFDRLFLPGVIGCRPGLGPHDALDLAVGYVKTATWILKVDFKDFFGSIDHAIAMSRLALRIGDNNVRHLIEQLMKRVPEGTSPPRSRGIAQGCPASPVIANITAQPVDEWIAGRGIPFVRYVDDVVLFFSGGSRADVERFVAELNELLPTVGLELASKKTVIAPAEEGVPFLGHIVSRTSNGEGHVRPDPERVARFRAWMHERANALLIATNNEEVRQIKNQMFTGVRAFSDYLVPHRDSLQVAAHAFYEATQAYPCFGSDQPDQLPPSGSR